MLLSDDSISALAISDTDFRLLPIASSGQAAMEVQLPAMVNVEKEVVDY